jgi:hypothetical protein
MEAVSFNKYFVGRYRTKKIIGGEFYEEKNYHQVDSNKLDFCPQV